MTNAWTHDESATITASARMLDVLDRWQRDFPLVSQPFAALSSAHYCTPDDIIETMAAAKRAGILGRIGATIRPNTVGASMLAAMRVPPERLDEVARIVNAEPGVNHNYEREHVFNLWFVIAASDAGELDQSLDRLRTATGLEVLELPLEQAYYIDLGFGLGMQRAGAMRSTVGRGTAAHNAQAYRLDEADRRLLAALEHGLPLVAEPYAVLGRDVGLSESHVMDRIARLIDFGIITRFGCIVRHRALGYRANAMVVFDVADAEVDCIGDLFAAQDFVTLCYRRPRRGADWPYNLFCMIHGQQRDIVRAQATSLVEISGLEAGRHALLFSRRCYLQRGTRVKHDAYALKEAAQ